MDVAGYEGLPAMVLSQGRKRRVALARRCAPVDTGRALYRPGCRRGGLAAMPDFRPCGQWRLGRPDHAPGAPPLDFGSIRT